VVPLLIPQPGWDVPEAHVGALWLRDDQVELVRHGLDPVHLVVGQLHQPVHLLLKADASPRSPLEPQFEDVVVSAALDDLVAGVVGAVVALVSLEQVVSGHLVAADQEAVFSDVQGGALQQRPHQLVRVPGD